MLRWRHARGQAHARMTLFTGTIRGRRCPQSPLRHATPLSSPLVAQPPSQPERARSPVALITATTPWPLSARLAVRMIAHGCAVEALCPRGHALGEVSGIGRIHRYSGRDSRAALERAIDGARPAIVMPCDDRAVWQLHELHERRPDLRALIEASIGESRSYAILRSRTGLMEMARGMGIRVPETQAIRSTDDIREWFRVSPGTAVLKLDGTWGGSGVQIVASIPEAEKTWRKFVAPESIGIAWKQWIINRDPLAFWEGKRGTRAVTIQKFVPGSNANAMLAAWQGELVGLASVEVLSSQGATGASTIVRLFHNEEIARTARTLVEGLGLSGFFGLDFILEKESKRPFLIEVNPRCTQLGHLILPGQGDLAGLLCARLGARGRPALREELPIDRELIAFFPQALAWNPDSPHMQQCHHDVPWSEPALVRELLRDPWPERQWLSRVYHWLRGRERHPLPSAGHFHRLAAQSGRVAPVGKELPDS
jgi:hypothetical protein